MAKLRNPSGSLSVQGGEVNLLSGESITFGDTGPFSILYDSSASEFQVVNNDTGNEVFNVNVADENITLNGNNTIDNIPAPTLDDEIPNKGYVDGKIEGLTIQPSSRVATDGTNIDLTSAVDPNPIDGVTLNNGDRILLKDQTDGTENGIYTADTATDPTTWTRAVDFDEDSEVVSGAFTFIEEGTANGSSSFIVTTDDPITVGVTAIVWEQFSSAGQFTAGDGLDLSGKIFSVDETFQFNFSSRIDFEGDLSAAGDGVKIFYGADLDMSTRYDAGEDELKWRDEANTTDRMSLARTTGDLVIDGTLDETSSP